MHKVKEQAVSCLIESSLNRQWILKKLKFKIITDRLRAPSSDLIIGNYLITKYLPAAHCHANGLSALHLLQSPNSSRKNGFLQRHVFDLSISMHSSLTPAHGVSKFEHFSQNERWQTSISICFVSSHVSPKDFLKTFNLIDIFT